MRYLLCLCVALGLSSCASIVSKKIYQVPFSSNPSEATITIIDKKKQAKGEANFEVYKGTTPTTVPLNASAGFFSKAVYEIQFEMTGYETIKLPLEAKVDGWYYANILFGGIIGILIVDPATGKMYALKTDVIHADFTNASTASGKRSLQIKSINELSALERTRLTELK